MTDVLQVLVVEDEDQKLKEWRDAIAAHNADVQNKGFLIEIIAAKTVNQAKQFIDSHRFDAAVVDLRLQVEPGVAENNSSGNDFVRYLIEVQPLGVVVYTGQQADAEHDSYNCPQVQVMDKGDGLDQVFDWLASNKEVFLRLRGAKAVFDRETAKLFFRSIWPRWSHWTMGAESPEQRGRLTDVVARHVVAHIHDSLLNAEEGTAHPEESYFVPPLKARLDTGDLVDYEGSVWIVVTPRCDLANDGKVKTVLLAACQDISADWDAHIEKKNVKELGKIVQHNRMPKQHYIAQMRDAGGTQRGPWLVQFHDLLALPAEQARSELTPRRFASLSPSFIPSLVERFGAYFSRIGTPDFSSE